MSITQKIFISLFVLALFSTLYVSSTMNALRDHYFTGVEDFKRPFYQVRTLLAIGLLLCLMLRKRFIDEKNDRVIPFLKWLGIASITVPLIIFALNYAPCLYKAPQPLESLQNVIKQSFLCPKYSIRSYVWPIIFQILGVLHLIASRR